MLRFLVPAGILAAALPVAAPASDRTPLSVQPDGTKISIEKSAVYRQGKIVQTMVQFDPPGGARGWTTFVSVDCRATTIYAARLPEGGGAYTIDPEKGAYRSIRPGSVGGLIAANLCPAHRYDDISVTSIGGGFPAPSPLP